MAGQISGQEVGCAGARETTVRRNPIAAEPGAAFLTPRHLTPQAAACSVVPTLFLRKSLSKELNKTPMVRRSRYRAFYSWNSLGSASTHGTAADHVTVSLLCCAAPSVAFSIGLTK